MSPDGLKHRFAWIAVALATAIRLFAGPRVATPFIVVALVIAAIVLTGDRITRLAAVFLITVSLIDISTQIATTLVERDFSMRSARHVDREVARVRRDITDIKQQLDANLNDVASRLAANPAMNRLQMFRMLRHEVPKEAQGRGMRIVARSGEVLAWWGDDLRVTGTRTYEFDATNLYITHSRPLSPPAVTVQGFERIVNQPKDHSLFDPDDDWILSTVFHAGVLRQESGSRRYVVERGPDSTLWIDVSPRSKSDRVASSRAAGVDTAAIFIALAALTMIGLLADAQPWLTAALIAVARIALLPLQFDEDRWHIFRFDVYASRILAGFSRSPFDLLLTAAAVLGIAACLIRPLAARHPPLVLDVFPQHPPHGSEETSSERA